MKVVPSIIAANFSEIQRELEKVEMGGADLLHLDIMDGVFVPNITFGPMIVKAIDDITELELDSHLMIIKPERYISQFIDAGSDWVSFHIEATERPKECINIIKERHKRVGIAISPPTPFRNIKKYLALIDYLLIMGVNPGFYGQKFIPETLKKISEAKSWLAKKNLPCQIQVDGGANGKNAKEIALSGADIIVSGAGVFKSNDYKRAIENLRCSRV
jgi:ribulose-phosphate 3-epimerase